MQCRLFALWLLWASFCLSIRSEEVTISSERIHLGVPGEPEWDLFQNTHPQKSPLRLQFRGSRNASEATLFIRQDDVKHSWAVFLNDRKLGELFLMEADLVHTLRVPPGTLRDGENELRIETAAKEDILLHRIWLVLAPLEEIFAEETGTRSAGILQINVFEKGEPIPARITLVTEEGALAPLRPLQRDGIAARPGVVYTVTGGARISLLPGSYSIYITRGPEYGLGEFLVKLQGGEVIEQKVHMERQVDTAGWVACDTHLHTVTYSKHGDATLRERLVTLAGEAVELPVATDHNLHADYQTMSSSTGYDRFFTIVPGNEVTTRKGHFNIFPVRVNGPTPNHQIEHWPELMKEIESVTEASVVILNHPTDTHSGFTPFAATNLNRVTGRNLRGFEFEFHGVEVINSGAMRSDWMEPFRAWFALLNYGYRVTGVGSSDSHDVSRFIAGQGRTYIRAQDEDPASLDVHAALRNLKEGRASISLGLFTKIALETQAGPGDLFSPSNKTIKVKVTVGAPNWMEPELVRLYANGREIAHAKLRSGGGPERQVDWTLPTPDQDTWIVAIASGPGVTAPYWAMARPYQPSSKEWVPVAVGATNPVWVDADGDGRFTSPRALARKLIGRVGKQNAEKLVEACSKHDWATSAQVADLLELTRLHISDGDWRSALHNAPAHVRQGFEDAIAASGK